MNQIIEFQGHTIDFSNIKSIEIVGEPISDIENTALRVHFLTGHDLVINQSTGKEELIAPLLDITCFNYGHAIRQKQDLTRKWQRSIRNLSHLKLLREAEKELWT